MRHVCSNLYQKPATYGMNVQEPHYHTAPMPGKNFDATPAPFYLFEQKFT
jgi:hypothetical protein